jgi:phage baseplate assembly protein W
VSDFERPLPSYRLAQTHWNDDLQAVAAREMGDANRWPELVWLNALVPPYITTDDRQVGASVLLAGAFIKVPAPASVWTDGAERGQVYERDCLLVGRQLTDDGNGDLAVVTGADNLRQQLQHAVSTPRGQARRHPEYGCLVWRLQGTVNGPVAAKLGAEYVKATLKSDYRVKSVDYSKAEVSGDAVRITARAVAIEGGVVDLAIN